MRLRKTFVTAIFTSSLSFKNLAQDYIRAPVVFLRFPIFETIQSMNKWSHLLRTVLEIFSQLVSSRWDEIRIENLNFLLGYAVKLLALQCKNSFGIEMHTKFRKLPYRTFVPPTNHILNSNFSEASFTVYVKFLISVYSNSFGSLGLILLNI